MESSKKILIVSDACYPELTPRAFRTTELASELAREGYHVTLLIPNRQVFLECPLQQEELKIIYADTPVEHAGGALHTPDPQIFCIQIHGIAKHLFQYRKILLQAAGQFFQRHGRHLPV